MILSSIGFHAPEAEKQKSRHHQAAAFQGDFVSDFNPHIEPYGSRHRGISNPVAGFRPMSKPLLMLDLLSISRIGISTQDLAGFHYKKLWPRRGGVGV